MSLTQRKHRSATPPSPWPRLWPPPAALRLRHGGGGRGRRTAAAAEPPAGAGAAADDRAGGGAAGRGAGVRLRAARGDALHHRGGHPDRRPGGTVRQVGPAPPPPRKTAMAPVPELL